MDNIKDKEILVEQAAKRFKMYVEGNKFNKNIPLVPH